MKLIVRAEGEANKSFFTWQQEGEEQERGAGWEAPYKTIRMRTIQDG